MRFEGIKGEGVQPAAFSACGGEEWRFYWDCGVEWVWIVCTLVCLSVQIFTSGLLLTFFY